MFGERDEMRKVFFESFRKYKFNLPVEPLEAQIIEILLCHPEYHKLFEDGENVLSEDFGDSNPFLHLSLHLAVREQIGTNRPAGIRQVYEKLCQKFHDKHVAEHCILECLGQVLWDGQRSGKMIEEEVYLERLRAI